MHLLTYNDRNDFHVPPLLIEEDIENECSDAKQEGHDTHKHVELSA